VAHKFEGKFSQFVGINGVNYAVFSPSGGSGSMGTRKESSRSNLISVELTKT
jgi:hypothetical protein